VSRFLDLQAEVSDEDEESEEEEEYGAGTHSILYAYHLFLTDLFYMKTRSLKTLTMWMTKLQDGIMLSWIALDILKRKTEVLKR
jgi:hypothetical protein